MPRPEPTATELAALDEILQVLFWMRGEGLAEEVGNEQLTPWIGVPPEQAESLLRMLVAKGLVDILEAEAGPLYRLTEAGVEEGGRRFRDEFSELTRQAHGECSDPDCDCHATGDPAQCSHHQPHPGDHHHAQQEPR